jgi:hypothetical protein
LNGIALLDLDGAWGDALPRMATLDLRVWGSHLRYCAPRAEVEAFDRALPADLPPFLIYGSGDFHYLSGLLVRRVSRNHPLTLVSFDNHPDWDIRPPHWGCGGWINRALEMPNVERAMVWGCGNFELRFPSRLFANHRALRSGRLQIHAWAERQRPSVARRFNCMTRENWREPFDQFARSLTGQSVYVTVDMDCLRAEEAVTNWENGLFAADDIAWAIRHLRSAARLVAGDICGARSVPHYARWRQQFAGDWDHPKLPDFDLPTVMKINLSSLSVIQAAFMAE